MYTKYKTEALIIGNDSRGEGDAIVSFLTRDFGLVRAEVKSMREERSHLRYALQPLTHSEVTLVRGKTSWRVVGARAKELYGFTPTSPASRAAVRRVAFLSRRLVAGDFLEHEAAVFFDTLILGLDAIVLHGTDPVMRRAAEALCVLRLLHVLGYVAPKPEAFVPFLKNSIFDFQKPILRSAYALHGDIVRVVNASLAASQL